MSDIKVRIYGEFQDQGFKKARKATSGLEKSFKKLGGTIASVFAAQQLTQFAKSSVKAFLESEKQAQRLRTQLAGINLEFASPMVTKYMNATALATGKASGELSDAFVKLSQATGDVTTAQELLQTALDISAATGMDLGSVSIALQRAYKGQTSALTRLNIGFTKNNLQGKKFDEILGQINKRFGGAQAAAAGTFAVKVERLSEAVQQAKEAFGKGFVESLDNSKVSVEELQVSVINLGKALGSLAALGTSTAQSIGNAFTSIYESVPFQAIFKLFEQLTRAGGFIVTGELIPSFDATAARRAGDERRKNEIAARNDLRRKNALIKAEQKLITTKKTGLTDEQKLKRAGTIFDMENIQIVAALQGRINEEQRLRLIALLAINNDIADAADKTTSAILALQAPMLNTLGIQIKASDNASTVVAKIVDAQTKIFLLNAGISNIPKAKNPFEDWDAVMKNIIKNLDDIADKIKKMPSAATTATTSTTTSITTPTSKTTSTTSTIPIVTPTVPNDVFTTSLTNQANVLATARLTAQLESIMQGFQATNDIRTLQYEAMQRLYPGRQISDTMTTDYQSYRAGERGTPTIVVNVAGSVTAESDLAETIREYLFDYQKTGGDIRTTAIAI